MPFFGKSLSSTLKKPFMSFSCLASCVWYCWVRFCCHPLDRVMNCCMPRTCFSPRKCRAMGSMVLRFRLLSSPFWYVSKYFICWERVKQLL